MGTARNFTAQYPDQVPERLYQGCDNTTTVSLAGRVSNSLDTDRYLAAADGIQSKSR